MRCLALAPNALSSLQYAVILSALLGAVVLYLLYKIGCPRDFGLPVRRRLFCRRLRIVRDQMAFAPLWWSDIQIQRAIRVHWKQTMQRGLPTPPPRASAG